MLLNNVLSFQWLKKKQRINWNGKILSSFLPDSGVVEMFDVTACFASSRHNSSAVNRNTGNGYVFPSRCVHECVCVCVWVICFCFYCVTSLFSQLHRTHTRTLSFSQTRHRVIRKQHIQTHPPMGPSGRYWKDKHNTHYVCAFLLTPLHTNIHVGTHTAT